MIVDWVLSVHAHRRNEKLGTHISMGAAFKLVQWVLHALQDNCGSVRSQSFQRNVLRGF